jgi:hypothetical protein
MEIVKKENGNTIVKKRSGRFGVRNKRNKWINGDEKADILLKAGLIKKSVAQAKPVVEETPEVAADEAPTE